MTHQLHLHRASEVVWVNGPFLDAKAKIAATRTAAQNMERDRFSTGYRAAQAQLEPPTRTFVTDLFEGL